MSGSDDRRTVTVGGVAIEVSWPARERAGSDAVGRPTPARYPGRCAWTGLPYPAGVTVMRRGDGGRWGSPSAAATAAWSVELDVAAAVELAAAGCRVVVARGIRAGRDPGPLLAAIRAARCGELETVELGPAAGGRVSLWEDHAAGGRDGTPKQIQARLGRAGGRMMVLAPVARDGREPELAELPPSAVAPLLAAIRAASPAGQPKAKQARRRKPAAVEMAVGGGVIPL